MILALGLEIYCYMTGTADVDSIPSRGLGDLPRAITPLPSFYISLWLFISCSPCYFHSHRPSHMPSFSPPFQLVHPYQVWLRKRCVSLPCKLPSTKCFFLRVCVCVCVHVWCVCALSLSYLNNVVFSSFSTYFFLVSSIHSAAPVCHSSPYCGFNCLVPCVCASFVFSIQAGQQSFREIQLNLSCSHYYLTVYPVGLSLSLRLPDFQIGHSVQWHIFPGRRRVPKFTSEPFTGRTGT